MYSLKKSKLGENDLVEINFSGAVSPDEMKKWHTESKTFLNGVKAPFYVKVNMTELGLLNEEAQKALKDGQKDYLNKGMKRSVVIVAKTMISLQMKRLAQETGIYNTERYISVEEADYQKKADKWLTDGVGL